MQTQIVHESLLAALDGRITFPESVKRLSAAGVERYRADLVRLETLHYAADGETFLEAIPLQQPSAIPGEFCREEVVSAIKDIQGGRIQYPEFLRRIMRAGVTDYTVSIPGKQAIYMGRSGESHVELFLPPKPAAAPETRDAFITQ